MWELVQTGALHMLAQSTTMNATAVTLMTDLARVITVTLLATGLPRRFVAADGGCQFMASIAMSVIPTLARMMENVRT